MIKKAFLTIIIFLSLSFVSAFTVEFDISDNSLNNGESLRGYGDLSLGNDEFLPANFLNIEIYRMGNVTKTSSSGRSSEVRILESEDNRRDLVYSCRKSLTADDSEGCESITLDIESSEFRRGEGRGYFEDVLYYFGGVFGTDSNIWYDLEFGTSRLAPGDYRIKTFFTIRNEKFGSVQREFKVVDKSYEIPILMENPLDESLFNEGEEVVFGFSFLKKEDLKKIRSCTVYARNSDNSKIYYFDIAPRKLNNEFSSSDLEIGNYFTNVVCRDINDLSWRSNSLSFEVVSQEVLNAVSNDGVTNSDGNSGGDGHVPETSWSCTNWTVCSNSVQSRTCTADEPRFERFSTKPAETRSCNELTNLATEIKPKNFVSKITGAVVGAVGERSTLGIGIFFIIISGVALIVYNRNLWSKN